LSLIIKHFTFLTQLPNYKALAAIVLEIFNLSYKFTPAAVKSSIRCREVNLLSPIIKYFTTFTQPPDYKSLAQIVLEIFNLPYKFTPAAVKGSIRCLEVSLLSLIIKYFTTPHPTTKFQVCNPKSS
jgi:hypothetical protein